MKDVNFQISKRSSVNFILIFTTLVVIDSTIVKFASYSGIELGTPWNTTIFVIFFIIFAVGSFILLKAVKNAISTPQYKFTTSAKFYHGLIIAVQILSIIIMMLIILQISILGIYNLVFLRAEVYISHICGFVFLSSLAFLFMSWLASNRNLGIILYSLSFIIASVNLLISLVYMDSYLSVSSVSNITLHPITSYVANLPGSSITESLSPVFDALSLISFLLMWSATVTLLRQYRHKFGRIKFLLIMSIPLIYYIFPLQGYFEDVFLSLLQGSSISFIITYILIFSATKQVGALLFSLVFLTASDLVYDTRTRKTLLISAVGMAVLFATFEISPLQYHVYPPFGFMTQALIPLGSYLLFVGIHSSAKSISRDSQLRKEFYRNASSQLGLLRAIGVSEMEKELQKRLDAAHNRSIVIEQEQVRMEDENVKEILHEVLNELYYSKGVKEQNDIHEGDDK